MNSTPETIDSGRDLTRKPDAQRRWRMIKDLAARHAVRVGGIGVIVAILLIFFYLLYVVVPMFASAEISGDTEYRIPGGSDSRTLQLATEEHGEIAFRLTGDGRGIFFRLDDGALVDSYEIAGLDGADVVSSKPIGVGSGELALGLSDGRVLVLKQDYQVTYPTGTQRKIVPNLEYPLGKSPLVVDEAGRELTHVAMSYNDSKAIVAAVLSDGTTRVKRWDARTNFLTGETTLEPAGSFDLPVSFDAGGAPEFVLVGPRQRWLYLANADGQLLYYDIRGQDRPRRIQRTRLTGNGVELTALSCLLGGDSLLAGDSSGAVHQWFPVRDEDNNYRLEHIRTFEGDGVGAITAIAPEKRRKGFVAADEKGRVGLYHTTSHQRLEVKDISDTSIPLVDVSPRANRLLAQTRDGRLMVRKAENEHPEVSWSALWSEVWYEGYPEPDHVWQSSASTTDFEPKLSLVPLSLGTLKAAFYAMLVAMPLAIMGAIYTAYFMSPGLRKIVKPTVEIMEAMPTVILGFLAGLWLAPVIEQYLPGIFMLLILMPVGMLLFGLGWSRLPQGIQRFVPEGWQPAVLIPVLLLIGWASFEFSKPVELALFGGNMPQWLQNQGIDFDQRNSIVVGLAMGFAVIPTIFSIAEDAIFGVPKHLSYGSLALGATPWQTLVKVVLPTASPGIFSGTMIGLGRAVGETMIVLMATGNTPITDFNIFEGMRTLSANIAVEMPESQVGSTHYRVLFLSALVLFTFTFVVNTLAELIRQRLRNKYSSL